MPHPGALQRVVPITDNPTSPDDAQLRLVVGYATFDVYKKFSWTHALIWIDGFHFYRQMYFSTRGSCMYIDTDSWHEYVKK